MRLVNFTTDGARSSFALGTLHGGGNPDRASGRDRDTGAEGIVEFSITEGSAGILVSTAGTFDWIRRTGKKVSVYVATRDSSVRSNTVTIR